jgi:hypothetical protein
MVDNDEIGGLLWSITMKSGLIMMKSGSHEKMSKSQSEQQEREQERNFIHHAEMHGGGGDAKRSRKQRAQVVCERTDVNGECTQTVLRGESLSYRKVGHTPGGINKTMIEHCSFVLLENLVKIVSK